MVRGSGFIILHMGSGVLSLCLGSSSMTSVLKITLKCVFSEGVMVKDFDSFLFTCRPENNRANYSKHKHSEILTSLEVSLTLVDSGNSPQVHCMWDSALRKLSAGFTINSESLLGDVDSDISSL